MISIPPHVTISRLIQRMKGKSSIVCWGNFPTRKRFWGRHVWARGYFCRSSGNVTDEVIKAYIAQQSHDSDDVFRIEGETSPDGDSPLGDSRREAASTLARLSGSGSGFSRNYDESLPEASAFRRWSIHWVSATQRWLYPHRLYKEQCIFLCHGPTKTGKSTYLATMRNLLGPYGKQTDMETFLHKDRPEVRNDLADLAGARYV